MFKYVICLVIALLGVNAFAESVQSYIIEEVKKSMIDRDVFLYSPASESIEIILQKDISIPGDVEDISDIYFDNLDKKQQNVVIHFKVKDEEKSVNAKYKEYIEIPVLKTKAGSGYVIQQQDLSSTRMDVKRNNDNFILNKDELIGKQVNGTVIALSPIKKTYISAPIIIKKKELITVLYKQGAVELKMTAIAVDDGRVGDTIRVKNTKSNIVLYATVENNKMVTVSN